MYVYNIYIYIYMDKERERNVIMCLCLMSSVDFQVESPTGNLFLDMMQKKVDKNHVQRCFATCAPADGDGGVPQ